MRFGKGKEIGVISCLYKQPCGQTSDGYCGFQGVVILKKNAYGDIDILRIVKVERVFYEYVNLAIFEGMMKVSGQSSNEVPVCVNPVASEPCCDAGFGNS